MFEIKLNVFVALSEHVCQPLADYPCLHEHNLLFFSHAEDRLLRKKVQESSASNALLPAWGQEVTVKMQCVLEDRTVVEKDCKLVFVIGEGDVNQVKRF